MSKMVKLQAIECMAGPAILIQAGDIFERDEKEAGDLVKAGLAIVVPQEESEDKPARKAKGHK